MGDSMASTDSARERLCGMCVQHVIYCKHNKDVFFILGFGFGFIGFGWAIGIGDLWFYFISFSFLVFMFGLGFTSAFVTFFLVEGGSISFCFGSDGSSGCLAGC